VSPEGSGIWSKYSASNSIWSGYEYDFDLELQATNINTKVIVDNIILRGISEKVSFLNEKGAVEQHPSFCTA
jgi:hypothetical protein